MSEEQSSAFEKVQKKGGGDQGVALTDGTVRALIALVARDLSLPPIEGIDPLDKREFFEISPNDLSTGGDASVLSAYCSLLEIGPDNTDRYFLSLATLHRARLKFANIARTQGISTLEQVGPRGLLQYGDFSTKALSSLLILRKWLFDIDNRSAQETGYLLDSIIAMAFGGDSVSAKLSPIKRDGAGGGRQVDCLRGKQAYEIKIRVTIAASGQGRWKEELAFPADCEASGYTPVLVVFDGTDNPKLSELRDAFLRHGGQTYVGEDAWAHLESEAGPTMNRFIGKYIRDPLDDLYAQVPTDLPSVSLLIQPDIINIRIDTEELLIDRTGSATPIEFQMPNDVDTEPTSLG